LSTARRLLIAVIALVTGAVGYTIGRAAFRPAERISQPIAFNHQKHTGDLGIDCSACHQFYTEASHSGLPMLSTCMVCHSGAQTDSPEEQKIRDLAAAGQDDVFRKLFRMPDHVFYSHRRHVAIANLPCERCHGGIARTERPPEKPLVRISMDFCLDCHRHEKASTDCTACHR
jgi:hypothetical protein